MADESDDRHLDELRYTQAGQAVLNCSVAVHDDKRAAAVPPPLPAGRTYRLVLADPPWLYRDRRTHASAGMALSAYPCLPVEEIRALPVGAITERDALLALWCTFPKLPEGLSVVEAWGFTYVTVAFTWLKTVRRTGTDPFPLQPRDIRSGLGHYTKANQELVLLGRKGRALPRRRLDVKQVVVAPVGRHSAKPPEVRDRLVALFGDVPRIELFARERVAGWDAWGLET